MRYYKSPVTSVQQRSAAHGVSTRSNIASTPRKLTDDPRRPFQPGALTLCGTPSRGRDTASSHRSSREPGPPPRRQLSETRRPNKHKQDVASLSSDTLLIHILFQSSRWYVLQRLSIKIYPLLTCWHSQASTTTSDPIPIETAHDDMIVCFVRYPLAHALTKPLEHSTMPS